MKLSISTAALVVALFSGAAAARNLRAGADGALVLDEASPSLRSHFVDEEAHAVFDGRELRGDRKELDDEPYGGNTYLLDERVLLDEAEDLYGFEDSLEEEGDMDEELDLPDGRELKHRNKHHKKKKKGKKHHKKGKHCYKKCKHGHCRRYCK